MWPRKLQIEIILGRPRLHILQTRSSAGGSLHAPDSTPNIMAEFLLYRANKRSKMTMTSRSKVEIRLARSEKLKKKSLKVRRLLGHLLHFSDTIGSLPWSLGSLTLPTMLPIDPMEAMLRSHSHHRPPVRTRNPCKRPLGATASAAKRQDWCWP